MFLMPDACEPARSQLPSRHYSALPNADGTDLGPREMWLSGDNPQAGPAGQTISAIASALSSGIKLVCAPAARCLCSDVVGREFSNLVDLSLQLCRDLNGSHVATAHLLVRSACTSA
eukprot:gnl/TRDRNA2_/TRDRNA2_157057_c0_seq1.p2 gnl/TRDRNA2_/TRDRNA2_157057_c0~~gnl/TRDRNA2_/TRDRNA2_157057_c0_seq1.p2  ORF type:complete len:117 (-),score=0.75 gnl/TRDRNA2_/TRDRNA2_157057_c0_seq1:555-905(-)